jgi:nucleolar complex protein 2
MELHQLAEKDPEFYKYLQDNDRELLDFNTNTLPEVDDEDMAELGEQGDGVERAPPLTMEILRQWQKALLEVDASQIHFVGALS